MGEPTRTDRCPSDAELSPIAAGQAPPPGLAAHLGRCVRCGERLAALRGAPAALADDEAPTRTAERRDGTAPTAPESIGKYRIVRLLGEGGQASAYLAVSPLGKNVVVKIARRAAPPADWTRDDLVEEGKLLASLEHRHLARVLDLDRHEGHVYLVLEHVPGRTLAQVVAQGGLPLQDAARVLALVAEAVDFAHRRGAVHRDLKPDNVLLRDDGQPCVIDFGIATLRDAWSERGALPGEVSGTLQFMAPEQASGETGKIGPRTDVFALGGIAYFLATGKPPFTGATPEECWKRAAACQIDFEPLARAPAALRRICQRALQARPEDRYPTAGALAAALRRFVLRPRRRAVLAALLLGAVGLTAAFLLRPRELEVEEASLWRARESGALERLLENDTVAPGDTVFLQFRADRAAHLYVGNEDAGGQRSLLFPTPLSRRGNPLAGGETHRLPLARVTSRGGEERLTIIASLEPIVAWERAARLSEQEWRQLGPTDLRPLIAEVVRGMEAISDAEAERVAAGTSPLAELFDELNRQQDAGRTQGGRWRRRVTLLNPR